METDTKPNFMGKPLDGRLGAIDALIQDKILRFHVVRGVVFHQHVELGDLRNFKATTPELNQQFQQAWGRDFARNPLYIDPVDIMASTAEAHAAYRATVQAENNLFQTEREFVESFLEREDITPSPLGIWQQGERFDLTDNDVLAKLQEQIVIYNADIPKVDDKPVARNLNSSVLLPVLSNLSLERQQASLTKLRDSIAYVPGKTFDGMTIDEVIADLLGIYYIQVNPINIQMFKHLLWQVCRKVTFRDIPYITFTSFYSHGGGAGKSHLMEHLSPVPWAFANGQLRNILKDLSFKAMIRNKFLINYDELAIDKDSKGDYGTGLDPAVISQIKEAITSDFINGRIMYGPRNGMERQTAIFVAATNKHLYDLIQDSSMRRYFEFELAVPSKDTLESQGKGEFYKAANKYLDRIQEVYQMIDENDDEGFFHPNKPNWLAIDRIQTNYAKADSISHFMADSKLAFSEQGEQGATFKEKDDFHSKIRKWQQRRGDRAWSSTGIEGVIRGNHFIDPVRQGSKKGYWVRPLTNSEVEAL